MNVNSIIVFNLFFVLLGFNSLKAQTSHENFIEFYSVDSFFKSIQLTKGRKNIISSTLLNLKELSKIDSAFYKKNDSLINENVQKEREIQRLGVLLNSIRNDADNHNLSVLYENNLTDSLLTNLSALKDSLLRLEEPFDFLNSFMKSIYSFDRDNSQYLDADSLDFNLRYAFYHSEDDKGLSTVFDARDVLFVMTKNIDLKDVRERGDLYVNSYLRDLVTILLPTLYFEENSFLTLNYTQPNQDNYFIYDTSFFPSHSFMSFDLEDALGNKCSFMIIEWNNEFYIALDLKHEFIATHEDVRFGQYANSLATVNGYFEAGHWENGDIVYKTTYSQRSIPINEILSYPNNSSFLNDKYQLNSTCRLRGGDVLLYSRKNVYSSSPNNWLDPNRLTLLFKLEALH